MPTRDRAMTGLVACALLLATPGAAGAQEPVAPSEQSPPETWSLAVDLAFTTIQGNEALTVFTTGATLTRLLTDQYEFEIGAQARYGQSEGEEVARELRANTSVTLSPAATVSPFVFATTEHDRFRRLDLRLSSGDRMVDIRGQT